MQVDAEGAKVRPAHTRCSTVILREIPADTQIQEIKVVFYIIKIKNVSSCTSLKKTPSFRLSLREYKKILPNTFIYESILIKKIDMNANIMNTKIFNLIKYDLNGH